LLLLQILKKISRSQPGGYGPNVAMKEQKDRKCFRRLGISVWSTTYKCYWQCLLKTTIPYQRKWLTFAKYMWPLLWMSVGI